jgi:hypothetical protein
MATSAAQRRSAPQSRVAPVGPVAPLQPTPAARSTSTRLDQLRARALRGDPLCDPRDPQREWVWRSLLKGIRLEEAVGLAGMTRSELAPALAAIRRAYQRRLDDFKQQPHIRTPVVHPAAPALSDRLMRSEASDPPNTPWWRLFGRRRSSA